MSLLKPGVETPFHIDFEWWQQNERDWQVFLRSLLCAEHQQALAEVTEGQVVDWIDEKTAEVRPVDGLQHALMTHCVRLPDFVGARTTLVESVFRTFLANGNAPLSAEDLATRLNRPSGTILRTLAGPRVYRGIRPLL